MDNQSYKLRQNKAFPNNNNLASLHDDGMDLRDYFAAKAMQGFLFHASGKSDYLPSDSLIAQTAYDLADAMMKAREQ